MVDTAEFKSWIRMQGGRQAKIEAEVERLMQPRYIKTEVHDDKGRWVPYAGEQNDSV